MGSNWRFHQNQAPAPGNHHLEGRPESGLVTQWITGCVSPAVASMAVKSIARLYEQNPKVQLWERESVECQVAKFHFLGFAGLV